MPTFSVVGFYNHLVDKDLMNVTKNAKEALVKATEGDRIGGDSEEHPLVHLSSEGNSHLSRST
ncbi:hypothetical protein N7540_005517 [Penicillium herquei]|nr:hypothetical protein N7540_005517 [Penicillium herquei]